MAKENRNEYMVYRKYFIFARFKNIYTNNKKVIMNEGNVNIKKTV